MLHVPPHIGLVSLITEPPDKRAFFIDQHHDELVVKPHDPTRWRHRIIAAICRMSDDWKQLAIEYGLLPVEIEAKHLITGLRKTLEDTFDLEPIAFNALADITDASVRNFGPVEIAKSYAQVLVSGFSDKTVALAQRINDWASSEPAKSLGIERKHLRELRDLAFRESTKEEFKDRPVSDQWAHDVILSARRKFHLTCVPALDLRIEALPVDSPVSPDIVARMRRDISMRVKIAIATQYAGLRANPDLDKLVKERFETVRSRMLADHWGIDDALALEIVRQTVRTRRVGQFTLPVLDEFPSRAESAVLSNRVVAAMSGVFEALSATKGRTTKSAAILQAFLETRGPLTAFAKSLALNDCNSLTDEQLDSLAGMAATSFAGRAEKASLKRAVVAFRHEKAARVWRGLCSRELRSLPECQFLQRIFSALARSMGIHVPLHASDASPSLQELKPTLRVAFETLFSVQPPMKMARTNWRQPHAKPIAVRN